LAAADAERPKLQSHCEYTHAACEGWEAKMGIRQFQSRAVSIQMLPLEDDGRWHFLGKNATWAQAFCKQRNRNRCGRPGHLLRVATMTTQVQFGARLRCTAQSEDRLKCVRRRVGIDSCAMDFLRRLPSARL